MSINRAILLGNVGSDPEVRTSQGGDKIATFRIATSETWKDKDTGERREATDWHTIVCFNPNIVTVIERYVTKGSKVSVEGSIKTRKWQDRDGNDRYSTEIVIGRFDGRLGLEGSASGERTDRDQSDRQSKGQGSAPRQAKRMDEMLSDEIPFIPERR